MGVDYGERRIGVALSDPLQITAAGFTVIDASTTDVIPALLDIIREHEVERVVVGLPVSLSGYEGASAQAARTLADHIAEASGLPVDLEDERFTTRTAESALLEANVRRSRRKQLVDQIAAAVMLQNYLNKQ